MNAPIINIGNQDPQSRHVMIQKALVIKYVE